MKVNIMSVELAIKRELAYREKLARLYPEDDWTKELLPLQVPSSTAISSQNPRSTYLSEPGSISVMDNPSLFLNPSCQSPSSIPRFQGNGPFPISDVASHPAPSSIDGLKPSPVQSQNHSPCSWPNLDMVMASTHLLTVGRATPSNFHSLADQQPQPGPGPYPVSDLTMIASHQVPSTIAGLKPSEVENQDVNPSLWPNLGMASTDAVNQEKTTATSFHSQPNQCPQPLHIGNANWFCQVCKVSCPSPYSYKQHMKGHKHKAKLQLLQMSRNTGGVNKPQKPICTLCQIWCTDDNSLELHFKGQKHKAKLKGIELGQKGTASRQLWCELCQVPCINEDSFRMHLQGKNHLARLHATHKNNNLFSRNSSRVVSQEFP